MVRYLSTYRYTVGIVAAVIITIVALDVILSTNVIESRNYGLVSVTYREVNLLEEPVIEVRLKGVSGDEPIQVKAYYPSAGGIGELDLERGEGARFQAEPRSISYGMGEVLEGAGWSDNADLGLLLFITRYAENESHIVAETMVTSALLKPSYLNLYKTIIEVDYKPNISDTILKTIVYSDDGTSQWDPLTGIDEECYRSMGYYYCYMWDLNSIAYDTVGYTDPLPILVTLINDADSADYIDMINHDVNMYLEKFSGDELMLSITLGIGSTSEIHVPGPGFSIGLGPQESRRDLLSLNCVFDNVYNDNVDNSGCLVDGIMTPSLGGSFERMGYVATGILGRIIVAEYAHGWNVCKMPSLLCAPIGAIGYSYAAWVIPATVGDGKLAPWALADDTAYYDDTVLDQIADKIYYNYTKSDMFSTTSSFIHVDTSQVFNTFRVSTKFGISVPVGLIVAFLKPELAATPIGKILYAISIGIAYNTYDFTEYNINADQTIYYDNIRTVTVNVYNATIDYYINELGDYYDAVVIAVDPD